MSDSTEKQQLKAAQRAVAEAQVLCKRHDAEHQAATKELEDNRSALLFMLEDLENARKKIEQAHQEWRDALDVIGDPIFLHDKEFRILRCNKAYQKCAGIKFKEIVGRPYYEIFPKTGVPLPCCLRAMEKAEEEVTVGDTLYRSRAFPIHDEQGVYSYSVHILEDITERRSVDESLRRSESKYRTLLENLQQKIFYKDVNSVYISCNKNYADDLNINPDEIAGKTDYVFYPAELAEKYRADDQRLMALGKPEELEESYTHDGQAFWVQTVKTPIRDSSGKITGLLSIFWDITKRRHVENQLRESEERLRLALAASNQAWFDLNVQTGEVHVSPEYPRLIGYEAEDFKTSMQNWIDNLHPDDCDAVLDAVQACLASGGPTTMQYRRRTKSGGWLWIHSIGKVVEWDDAHKPLRIIGIHGDISESKQAEIELRESEQKFMQLFMEVPIPLGVADREGVISYFNKKFTAVFGYTVEDVPTLNEWWLQAYPNETYRKWVLDNWNDGVARAVKAGTDIESDEYTVTCKNGAERIVVIGGHSFLGGVLATFNDITERKRHEIAMQRANRALRTISAGNQTLIHVDDEAELLQKMCDVAVQVGGYRMAWIGYAREDADKTIELMAHAGLAEGCPMLPPLSWADVGQALCPAGHAIVTGATYIVQDLLSDPGAILWHDHIKQHGYASGIALPLTDGKHTFGALVLFDDKVNVFDTDEVKLLEEMSGDLAFGIITLRIKVVHLMHEQRLQENMLQTVEAIARIVEMRDPYTSGHQARVAELARMIARQMGSSDEQVHAIHLAGLVHDLGKIRIPAEILSKPGRLNEIEFSLIKMHPQAGYDILKGIDFSWPIAQMVLQHHEHLDGSGYPQGLKGEEILLGARILSVADVIEAMSSHRPYRPGLGMDAALAEITRMRGIHYDLQVVDACVTLFKEQGYALAS